MERFYFRLSAHLGKSVYELKQFPLSHIREWMVYESLEPFGDRRIDIHAARILTMLANINRDSKKQKNPFETKDFMLNFDKKLKVQSVEEMEMACRAWAIATKGKIIN